MLWELSCFGSCAESAVLPLSLGLSCLVCPDPRPLEPELEVLDRRILITRGEGLLCVWTGAGHVPAEFSAGVGAAVLLTEILEKELHGMSTDRLGGLVITPSSNFLFGGGWRERES